MHQVSNQTIASRPYWHRFKIIWQRNHLLRNSAFLAAASIITAALGFGFWALVARLFSPHDVGLATSLISTASLVAYLSLFGLNSSLVRFLPVSGEPDALVTQAVGGVAAVATVVGTGCVLLFPFVVPSLSFVRDGGAYGILFVAGAVATALNLLTDAVFIARRRTGFNALTSGLLQGIVKVALPVFMVGVGAMGIFGAVGAGAAAALIVSLVLMRVVLGLRVDLGRRRTAINSQVRYSTGTYASSVLNLVPMLVVPLIVLERLGAADAGYYYVAFQVATLLLALATAVGEALFAEGSHDGSAFVPLLRRSGRLLALILVPASVGVALLSGLILQVFGTSYREQAQPLLIVLCVNAIFLGVSTWANFALKIVGDLRALVIANGLAGVVVIGLSVALSGYGLVWTGVAWLAGTSLAAGYAAWAVRRHARTRTEEASR